MSHSLEEVKDEGAASGYAEHLHWCPHVAAHVAPIDLAGESALASLDPHATVCSVDGCDNRRENWLCLHCHTVFCGRFARGHMVAHRESTGHCVAAGFEDISFWCYQCEGYLYHRTIPKLYQVYTMLTLMKFHEPPVDGPLPSAEPLAPVDAEFTADDDTAMETSAMRHDDAPTRASSQLSAFSDHSSSSSAAPSRTASELTSTTVLSPIVGLSPLQLAHPLVQKICGIIYGNALGDAFGLSTEFESAKAVQRVYGPTYDPATGEGAIPFPKYRKSAHSRRWQEGDWTDDTDQMILIMETILESYSEAQRLAPEPSVLSEKLFAKKLSNWVRHGFSELGDPCGMGLGALTHQVVTHSQFLRDPHGAAHAVWSAGGRKAAANGGVMRTSILGVFDYESYESVVANTLNMCRVTHADPRCTASCLLTTSLLSAILQGAAIDTETATEKLIERCLQLTLDRVDLGDHRASLLEYVGMRTLAELQLDDPPAIGFTLKCLASGLYGLRSREAFIPTMTRLVREAGDADTNGAVCGALLGARLGYDGLPADWLNAMPNKAWLDAKVVQLIKLMMDRFDARKKDAEAATASSSSASSSSSSAAAATPAAAKPQ